MGLFKKEPTLDELEQENEKLEYETTSWRYKAQIARLKKQIDAQGGKGFWKVVGGNAKGDNLFGKLKSWFTSH